MPILIDPVCDHPRRVITNGPSVAPAAAAALRKSLRFMLSTIADSFLAGVFTARLNLEILSPHLGVRRKVPHAPAEHDLPFGHDVDALRQRQRRLHRLLDEQ